MNTSITSQMEDHQKKIEELRLVLLKEIDMLPDNPRISRISNNCFTINVKDIGPESILSPFYHDFKAQYRAVIEIIKEYTLENAIKKVNIITSTGLIMHKNQTMHFHPDVITNLKRNLE